MKLVAELLVIQDLNNNIIITGQFGMENLSQLYINADYDSDFPHTLYINNEHRDIRIQINFVIFVRKLADEAPSGRLSAR